MFTKAIYSILHTTLNYVLSRLVNCFLKLVKTLVSIESLSNFLCLAAGKGKEWRPEAVVLDAGRVRI